MASRTRGTHPQTDRSRDGSGVAGESSREMLRDYADDTWDVPDDVPDSAEITDVAEEICKKEIVRTLTVDEQHVVEEHSPSAHAEFDPGAYFVDAPFEDRAELVPTVFDEETFRFLVPGSEEQSNCSKCHSRGRLACGNCSGQGNRRCRSCDGTGVATDSSGNTVRCKKCNGNGSRPCSRCDGVGDTVCDRCDGSGRTIKFEYIERQFFPQEETEVVSDTVPEKYVLAAAGQHRTTDELPVQGDTVRQEKEVRDVPVTVLEYEYDDKEYRLFEVEHELMAPSHPRDVRRWAMAVAAAIGVLALCAGLYTFVL